MTGWALDAGGPPSSAVILVDGQHAASARVDCFRPDIAAQHPNLRRPEGAGWEAAIDLRAIRGPTATISLLVPRDGVEWVELARTELEIDQSRAPSGLRSRAVFTIAQNEPTFLPLWLRYYGDHFDPEDIYLLDHDSTDGSTDGLEGLCNVVRVHRNRSFDHAWMRSTVEDFHAFLLRSYDAVLFTDADEFVVADPSIHDGLAGYIDGLDAPAARCTGYNVVHYPDEEPKLRFDQPLLEQRRYWHRSEAFSKRLLGRMPLAWATGFHHEHNADNGAPDPGLYLIHLHRIDYEHCRASHREVAGRRWSEDDLEAERGTYHRLFEGEEFRDWFFSGDDLRREERELIPDHIRSVL